MKQLFALANAYIGSRDWKMLTLVKFCLASLGLLLGLNVPARHRKAVFWGALQCFCPPGSLSWQILGVSPGNIGWPTAKTAEFPWAGRHRFDREKAAASAIQSRSSASISSSEPIITWWVHRFG